MRESNPQLWFANQLKRLHAAAGRPTQAQLLACDRKAEQGLNRSSLSDLLAGKFTKAPPWERISAYVTACVQHAQDQQIDLSLEQELRRLREDHARLTELLETTTPKPVTRASSATGSEARHPIQRPSVRRFFGAVPVRAGAFQHRAISEKLARVVEGGDVAVLIGAGTATPASVLTGLGGVGKTQLAADHAHARWEAGEVDLLIWVSARNRDGIVASYIEAAVDLLHQDPATPERTVRRLQEWLAETDLRWLVVLDDVQDPADLNGLWPPNSTTGQVVVTTRCRDAALHGHRRQILDVDLFTATEAVAYLAEKLPARARTESGATELAGLAADVGYLPLALAQAAAYLINKPLLDTASYRTRLADRRTTLRDVLPRERDLPDEHQQTVAATWALSIDAADQLDPPGVARPILEMAALLDSAGIPAVVFSSDATTKYLASRLGRDVNADEAVGGLECLQRFSLLTVDPDEPHRAVRVHALVQRAARETLFVDSVGALARATADALLSEWPPVENDREQAHAFRTNTGTLQDTAEEHLWTVDGHDVMLRVVNSLGKAGLYVSANPQAKRLCTQACNCLGPDHPFSLSARGVAAVWRGKAGDPEGAATALADLLADQQRVQGPEHPDTLGTRSELIRWRGRNGAPRGTAAAFEELVVDMLRVLGPDHPQTLTTRYSCARWRGEAGDAAGAVAALEELLADRLRVLGPDHPDTLQSGHSLAWWRGEAGYSVDAANALEDLLVDHLRVFGPDHPDTLSIRNSIARWRGKAGHSADAANALEDLLVDHLRVFGPDHPDTYVLRSNAVQARGESGDPRGAVAGYEDLLADRLRILGPDHPDTLATRHHLARWREKAGDRWSALDTYTSKDSPAQA